MLYGVWTGNDQRLRTFLDLQLKLYSQVDAEAALLYAATAVLPKCLKDCFIFR